MVSGYNVKADAEGTQLASEGVGTDPAGLIDLSASLRAPPVRARRLAVAKAATAPTMSRHAECRFAREATAAPSLARYRFCCSYVKKLMVMSCSLVGLGRLEEVPDAAGEVAFEAADGFAGVLPSACLRAM